MESHFFSVGYPGIKMRSAKLSFVLNDFSFGIDWASPALAMDKRSLSECINFNITKSRSLQKRSGIEKKYATSAANSSILDLYEYRAPNGVNYLLVAVDTFLKYYLAGWNTLKSGLTTGKRYSFTTHLGACYVVNGTDSNFKLYNTVVSGVGIATPTVAPTTSETGTGTGSMTGKWRHAYSYKRTDGTYGQELIGNYVEGTDLTVTACVDIQVNYTISADPQVDKIVIWRTLDLTNGASTLFYKVDEVANATSHYHDSKTDNQITVSAENDNTVPPKATFVCLHKDRVFYANCPAEKNGGSLVCWSKVGRGEAVPSANYEYFDREDGEIITGIASVADYLLVFKRNKIFVLAGGLTSQEDSTKYTIGRGIGCISPYAIIPMNDGICFLSEEGFKFCDGKNYYNISSKINRLAEEGYFTSTNKNLFSAAYYPEKYQMYVLLRHGTLSDYFLVGHFLTPLLAVFGENEEETGPYVAWTMHNYKIDITTVGTFTDSAGITKLCVGTTDGFIYQIDKGFDDEGESIVFRMKSGWTNLGVPTNYTKTMRMTTLSYLTQTQDSFNFIVDVDFVTDVSPEIITGVEVAYCGYAYCGSAYCGSIENTYDSWCDKTAKVFRYGIYGDNDGPFEILEISSQFRVEGLR